MQNSCSVGEEVSEVTTVPPDTSDPVIDQPINGAPSDNSNIKSMEERETDNFLGEDKKSQSHKKKEVENIVQDVFDFMATSAPEKNYMTEIFLTAHHEKSYMNNPPNISQNLACLIQEAWDAKDEAIRANQKELLCWCSYIIEFNKKTIEFTIEYKVGEKKAKGMIYDNLTKLIPPGTKRNTIQKQT
ncbi:hypothetical protein C1646_766820 [Rhizophagus diaphanus]|nr:hypothetical protein C1646_766820 [Rhizophagus diaphanus] [Rhizophagus sp. MUCL 43196]